MRIRLKSLEMQGFKTFASRTLFEFPGQITAIVGPNGSGKSNISDSARWVLGEQAYSLLRAKKTEDMIFSGSEQRTKSGMASVTITFLNEDNWLPIDYDEVSVTRRAYRDGQNEYLINGQRVRLKEINELLSSSGLAERTYTIIGQGLVDTALSLKSDERRRFFEEAAGIGLYRTRRDEAINRLDVTRRNLERVEDILSELTPRLHSLERQAKKARDYHNVLSELHGLLKEWYGFHWHRIQQEVLKQRAVVKTQEERLLLAREKSLTVDSQITLVRQEMNEMRQNLNVLHAQSAELHSEMEKTNRDLAVFDERKKSIVNQYQNLQSEAVHLEQEQKRSQERLAALDEELDLFKTEVDQAKTNLDAEQAALKEMQQARSVIENSIAQLRKKVLDYEMRKAQKRAKLEELGLQQQRLEQQLEGYSKKITDFQPRVSQFQQQIHDLQQQLEDKQTMLSEKEGESEQIHRKLIQSGDQKQQLQQDYNRLTLETGKMRAQKEVMNQAEKALSGWGAGAKKLLEMTTSGKISGKFTALLNELQIPKEYERAVSAAFGEYLEALVVENKTDLDTALVMVEKEKTDRVMFLSSAKESGLKEKTILQGEDVIGNLGDLVQISPALLPLLGMIANKTILVKDRQAAFRYRDTLPEDARMVTLQGEIFNGSHTVIAGELSNQSLLARPRMLKELTTLIIEHEQKEAVIANELKDMDSRILNLNQVQKQLQQDTAVLRKERDFDNRQLQDISLQSTRVQQQIEFLQNQIMQTQGEIEKNHRQLEQLRSSQQEMDGEGKELESELTRKQAELKHSAMDETVTQVNFWKTNLAVAQKALQDAERRNNEYTSALSGNQMRILKNKERIAELSVQEKALEEQRMKTQEISQFALQRLTDLRSELDPKEKQLAQIEKDYDESLTAQVAAQQALSVAERYHSQAQLEQNRKNEELESLRRKVEDDFGLVAFPYTHEISGPTPLPLDDFVEKLPHVSQMKPDLEESITRQRAMMKRMGAINQEAQSEYEEVSTRHEFLTGQVNDLKKADNDLHRVIEELDFLMQQEFHKTFEAVAAEFKVLFTRLFGGGSARLVLVEDEKSNEAGIDIEARLPGKREQGLALLSGGERSLTAVALIFSLLKVSPTPFCVLDEVDAMLDEANVGRFGELLQELSEHTQFIVITHNRTTVQIANVIYGVTMGRDSTSQIISLKIDQLTDDMVR